MLNKIYINADGGSRGNPGPGAIGITIRDSKNNYLIFHKEFIGKATNNAAEYRALVKSLELASKFTNKEVNLFMDSELIIRQMKGEYKVKAGNLVLFFMKAKKLEKNFEKVNYKHVRREDKFQSKADALVNEALDARELK